MVFVVICLLFKVCCLLFVMRVLLVVCLWFVARGFKFCVCPLFVDFRSLFTVVRCLLSVVCYCLLLVVCYSLFVDGW